MAPEHSLRKGSPQKRGAPKRFYVRTFGCQMNERDSEALAALLGERGYEPTAKPELADLVLLNTCSVREGAENKVWSLLGEMRPLKRENPGLIVAVGGCVAQQHGERLLERAPVVDLVFGTAAIRRLPELVEKVEADGSRLADTPRSREWSTVAAEAEPATQGPTAIVTTQRGCNRRCRFCIVPTARGPEANRPLPEIVEESRRRVMRGAKEITLIGQNITAYHWTDENGRTWRLADVLREVARAAGAERVRFLTAHPAGVGEDLVRALAEVPCLCPHVHLPVQSGSDRVLESMGRGHDRATYLRTARALRRARPGLALTTDLIVGFPGETAADFEDTLGLVEEVAFDGAFCFKYSPRPGTRAFGLGDPISGELKARRLAILQDLCGRYEMRSNNAMVGREESILVEGASKDRKGIMGRTGSHKIVNTEGNPTDTAGKLVRVSVLRAGAHSLRGIVIDIPADGVRPVDPVPGG